MVDRDAFLAAIQKDWTDFDLRKVYADWLEEHGDPAEAEYQRNFEKTWREAENWFIILADSIGEDGSNPFPIDTRQPNGLKRMGARSLVDAGTRLLDGKGHSVVGGDVLGMDMMNMWDDDLERSYWKYYEIYTGRPYAEPPDIDEDGNNDSKCCPFTCCW